METTDITTEEPNTLENDVVETTEEVQTEETPLAAEAQEQIEAVQEEYAPSFKYKVRDEEFDMDEWAKEVIKNEEMEKRFQDLYTRGHGLDLAKKERDELKSTYEEVNEKYTGLQTALNNVNELVMKGDASGFIQALGLPKDMFIQYAINELKYQQLPAEEKARIDAERQQQAQLQQLAYQNQQLQTDLEQTAVAQRETELSTTLADPSVASIAQEYETSVGKPGAFRDLVIERGRFHSLANGVDISARDAVNEVIQILGRTQGTGTVQNAQVGTPQAQQKKVIPNIPSQGTVSPAKKTVGSINDIRERFQQLSAQQ
jgi:hypothetical protein